MVASGRTIIEEIKSRIDIVEVIGSFVELRRTGSRFKALCPFHQEKTPSFIVFPERQTYHCFGCGKSGDVISFLMETQNLSFREAVEQLAQKAGVRFEPEKPKEKSPQSEIDSLYEINKLAARLFNHLLMNSKAAEHARDYLKDRGLSPATWEEWMLGYAPDSWDVTSKFLQKRGFSEDLIFKAGLTVERTGGGYYDRFRDRLMFPIKDKDGRFVGFGGRAIGEGIPKYMNTPETPIFTKGEHIYGIDVAKSAIKESNLVVVVEGYVDVITAHQHGFRNVVATLGTAITPSHVKLLSKMAANICLALDADTAGQAAALRGWEVLRDSIRRRSIPIRSKGRVISSDSKLEVLVKIATLPKGEDPDTLIRKDPSEWARIIEGAKTVIDHFFEIVERGYDLKTPQGKTQAIADLAPVIGDLGNPIERAHYESRLAKLVGVDENEIHLHVVQARKQSSRPGGGEAAPINLNSVSQEEMVLALLIRYPRLLGNLPEDFINDMENSPNKEILEKMQTLGQEKLTPESLLESVDESLRQHVERLVALASTQPELFSNEQLLELNKKINLIRRQRLRDLLHQHSLLLKEAMEQGDEESVRSLLQLVPTLASELRQYDPPASPYFKDSRSEIV